jgi:MYXO-CTERM domain-containing protein
MCASCAPELETTTDRPAALAMVGSPAAPGERPRGVFVPVPPDLEGEVRVAALEAPTIIYMNREGGTYTPGQNNSATNRSTIPSFTATVPNWNISETAWQQVLDCVTAQFAPFNTIVTDVDPGDVDHIESVVAGRPQDIGLQSGIGGVSPFSCGIIDRSIVFTFAEVYGANYQEICHTAAQEIAHSFGLDHEYLCADPMTYLGGCGAKTFQDVDASCGEFSRRSCQCGGSSQNSVQMMLTRLGVGDQLAPEVSISEPQAGAIVLPGFEVEATATDDIGVMSVDLYIDGAHVATEDTEPYRFPTAPDLEDGTHNIEVVASDGRHESVSSIDVTVSSGADTCDEQAPCDDGERCVDGVCQPDEGGSGGGEGEGEELFGGCSTGGGGGGLALFLIGCALAFGRRRKRS